MAMIKELLQKMIVKVNETNKRASILPDLSLNSVIFNGEITFDSEGVYTFSEPLTITNDANYNIQLGDNIYSGQAKNFSLSTSYKFAVYFTTINSIGNYLRADKIVVGELANQTINLIITNMVSTNIDEKYLPSSLAKVDVIPTKLTDIKLNSKSYFILASTTENSTKNFKITVDDNGVLNATEHCELYSAAFKKKSISYINQATLNVETTNNVESIVLLNDNDSVMTPTTSYEIDSDGNKIWTLKFKTGNSTGVKTFTVYGVTGSGIETERASVFTYVTRI